MEGISVKGVGVVGGGAGEVNEGMKGWTQNKDDTSSLRRHGKTHTQSKINDLTKGNTKSTSFSYDYTIHKTILTR